MKVFFIMGLINFSFLNLFSNMPIYKEMWYDLIETNYNMFSKDTVAIGGIILPFYFLAKQHDHKLHNCFYDRHKHKNLYAFPKKAHDFANHGQLAIVAALAPLIFVSDPEIKSTATMLWIGLPYVYGLGVALKKTIPAGSYCIRPKNQHFDKHKKVYGGFPSGHMLEMTYIFTLFAFSLGYKWAIPIGAYTAFMAIDFTVGNRHYASQVIAGAAIGAAFGYASYKAVNDRICEKWSVGCSPNGLCVGYNY